MPLAYIRLPATEPAGKMLEQMIVGPTSIYNTACQAIDLVENTCNNKCENLVQVWGELGKY